MRVKRAVSCPGVYRYPTQCHPRLQVPESLSRAWRPGGLEGLPQVFTGGWVGYAGYDTVRYVYASKLPFSSAPHDDRGLADMHLALYNDVVVFDQATKIVYAISWVHVGPQVRRGWLLRSLRLRNVKDGMAACCHLQYWLFFSPSQASLPRTHTGRLRPRLIPQRLRRRGGARGAPRVAADRLAAAGAAHRARRD